MPQDAERPTLTLKNGAVVDARTAYVYWQRFEVVASRRPEQFLQLLALAQDDTSVITPETRHEFHERYRDCVNPDGVLAPLVQAVLRSGGRVTTEGPVMANPFLVNNAEEATLLERLEQETTAHLRRLMGGGSEERGRC